MSALAPPVAGKNAIRWQPMKNDRSISPLRRVNLIPSSDRWSKTNRTAPLSRARVFERIIHPVTNRPDSSCRNCFKCCRQNLKSTQEKHDLRRFAIDTGEQGVVHRFHASRLPPIAAHRFWHQPQMRWHPIDIKKKTRDCRVRVPQAQDRRRSCWCHTRWGRRKVSFSDSSGVRCGARALASIWWRPFTGISQAGIIASVPGCGATGRWNRGSISRTANRHSRELAAAAIRPARDILAR